MSTATMLLALLEAGPSHGYTLKQRYDEHFARPKPVAFGQVYASLGRFEKAGLAEALDVESGAGPERRRYRITPDGVTRVEEWLSEPQPPDLFATSSLFARVTVALLSGRDAADVLAVQRGAHLARMRELQALRRTASGADLLAVTYELTHLDADLRWIEDAGKRLAEVGTQLAGAGGDDAHR